MKSYAYIGLIVISIISSLVIIKTCKNDEPTVDNPPVQVTPIVDPHQIDNVHLPSLPNNATPVSVIPVIVPTQTPGIITTPNVVVGSDGNTYIANTTKVDWGFRCKPGFILGYDNKVFGGLGINVFKIWRFDTDILATVSSSDLTNDIKLGIGESFQVTNNVNLGVSYQCNSQLDTNIGCYVSFKF